MSVTSSPPMQIDSTTTNLLTQNLQTIANLGQSEQANGYKGNDQFAQALQNVTHVAQQGMQNYFAPNSGTNGAGQQFLANVGYQMGEYQTGLNSGNSNLPGTVAFAQEALKELGATGGGAGAAGGTGSAGSAAGTGGTAGSAAGASTGSASGTSGFQQVDSDLANEAQATDTGSKAGFVQSAIKDLIGAINGGPGAGGSPSPAAGASASPGAGSTAAGGAASTPSSGASGGTGAATPTSAGTGSSAPAGTTAFGGAPTPAQSGSLSPQTASQLLDGLDQLSHIAQQGGAPGSLQDGIASLVGQIENLVRPQAGGGASTASGASGPASPSGAASSGTQATASQQPSSVPPLSSSDSKALVPILQELSQVLNQLQPLLSKSPNGGSMLDNLAQVIGQLAQAVQAGSSQHSSAQVS